MVLLECTDALNVCTVLNPRTVGLVALDVDAHRQRKPHSEDGCRNIIQLCTFYGKDCTLVNFQLHCRH